MFANSSARLTLTSDPLTSHSTKGGDVFTLNFNVGNLNTSSHNYEARLRFGNQTRTIGVFSDNTDSQATGLLTNYSFSYTANGEDQGFAPVVEIFMRNTGGSQIFIDSVNLKVGVDSTVRPSNFRVSVWGTDPSDGGHELWGQDYFTTGELPLGESLVLKGSDLADDGVTSLHEVNGRFVRVQLLGNSNAGNGQLAVAEIDVSAFDESNLAVAEGIVSQSSTVNGNLATNGVDGDRSTYSETSTASNSWWQVGFVQQLAIGDIEIFNRDDAQFDELSNFKVAVWDFASEDGGQLLWSKDYYSTGSVAQGGSLRISGNEIGDDGTTRLSTVSGRVVRIQTNGNNNAGNGRVSVADVRVVRGKDATQYNNVALTGIATQSRDYYERDGHADVAINQVVFPDSDFTSARETTTSKPWWQVDLQQAPKIEQIVIVNRKDVADRIGEFRVSVWDGDPNLISSNELWGRDYSYDDGDIPADSALTINGNVTSGGTRLDSLTNGQFVRIEKYADGFLSLAEVQVWSTDTELRIDPAQTTFNFDLGTRQSPVRSGWARISPTTHGDVWWDGDVAAHDGTNLAGVNEINRDFVRGTGPASLNIKVPNGIWRATLNMGDPDGDRDQMLVYSEGQLISNTVASSASGSPNPSFPYVVFNAEVNDGELNIQFDDAGGVDPEWVLTRLSLEWLGPLQNGIVEGRYVFYNDSSFDGDNAGANAADDAARATDKFPLLPGGIASFANYTSYANGINGLFVDIANAGDANTISSSDFIFATGNGSQLTDFTTFGGTVNVSTRIGAGVDGTDRVSLTFANGLISNTWLQITVRATAHTGLAEDDVFYFGNAIGEAGGSDPTVDGEDVLAARANRTGPFNPPPIDNDFDFDRSGAVDSIDVLIARSSRTSPFNVLKLITAPQGNSGSIMGLLGGGNDAGDDGGFETGANLGAGKPDSSFSS